MERDERRDGKGTAGNVDALRAGERGRVRRNSPPSSEAPADRRDLPGHAAGGRVNGGLGAVGLRERMGRTLLVAYVTAGAGQAASQLYFFLVFRSLPVPEVGVYSWAIAIATIYAYVMDFGLVTFLVGELSDIRYRLGRVILGICIVRSPLVIVAFVLFDGLSRIAGLSPVEYWVLMLVTLSYVLQLAELGLISWLQVREQQNSVNVVVLVMPLGRVVGIGVPLWLGLPVSLWYVTWLVVATQGMSAVCLGLLCRLGAGRDGLGAGDSHGVWYLLRRFWKGGRTLTVMYLLTAVQSRLDWLLVSSVLSKVALANYSLANKILEVAMVVAGIGARTSFPWQSRADAEEPQLKARLASMRRVFIVMSALVCAGLFFWSPLVVSLVFGGKYSEAEGAMRLMTLTGSVFMLNQYLFYSLLARKLEGAYTRLILLATLVQIVVDVALLPRLGIVGAALGMLAMGTIVHVGQLRLLSRESVLAFHEIVRIEVFLLGSIGMMAVLWFASPFLLVNTFIAWLLVGVFGCLLVLDDDDRRRLLSWAHPGLGAARM